MNDVGESHNFCPIPWTQVVVRDDGEVQTCNRHPGRLHVGARKLDLLRDGVDAIWNGAEVVELRRALARGEQPALCRECWHTEAVGARSLRQTKTDDWRAGHLNPERQAPDDLVAATDFRLGRGPASVQLDVGNLCNLACRMCNAGASSRIQRDLVHSSWTGRGAGSGARHHGWYSEPAGLDRAMALLADAEQLHVIGGEPALIPDVARLFERIVDQGLAPRLQLSLHTNATVLQPDWLPLLPHFRSVVFYVSLDGAGEVYQYIRYPARWERVAANVLALQAMPHIEVRAHIVVQNLNVVGLTDLLHWLDHHGIEYAPHLLDTPARLRPAVLPQAARQLAADRLEAYLQAVPSRAPISALSGMVTYLRDAPLPSPALIRSFMEFTNDLDASRRQSFAHVHPELVAMFAAEGYPWCTATRFSTRMTSARRAAPNRADE